MFKRAAVLAVLHGALLSGCGTDVSDPRTENEEIVSNLIEAGFPADDIMVVDDAVYVGRDAHVTLEASREMLQPGDQSAELVYTANLVSHSISRICINPSSSFNSYTNLSMALYLAIENYNQQPLTFDLVRGPNSICQASINITTMSGTGGSSGFPSGGLPYNQIFIGAGLNSYNLDVIEHVITHEIGHTIGLRHTDWYDSSISCGTNGGSGIPDPGYVPTTPGSPPPTPKGSIMNTCIWLDTNGEFTSSDITGLNYLY